MSKNSTWTCLSLSKTFGIVSSLRRLFSSEILMLYEWGYRLGVSSLSKHVCISAPSSWNCFQPGVPPSTVCIYTFSFQSYYTVCCSLTKRDFHKIFVWKHKNFDISYGRVILYSFRVLVGPVIENKQTRNPNEQAQITKCNMVKRYACIQQ